MREKAKPKENGSVSCSTSASHSSPVLSPQVVVIDVRAKVTLGVVIDGLRITDQVTLPLEDPLGLHIDLTPEAFMAFYASIKSTTEEMQRQIDAGDLPAPIPPEVIPAEAPVGVIH